MPIDTNRILAEVAAKHGFAINENDVLIAFATVNSVLLEELMRQAGSDISTRIAAFNATIDNLERRAGEALGQQTAKLVNELRTQLTAELHNITPAGGKDANPPDVWWPLWISAVSLAAFLLGILAGKL